VLGLEFFLRLVASAVEHVAHRGQFHGVGLGGIDELGEAADGGMDQ